MELEANEEKRVVIICITIATQLVVTLITNKNKEE